MRRQIAKREGPRGDPGRARGAKEPASRRLGRILGWGAILLLVSGTFTCPSRLLLGIPCPGCGMTRATWALMRLDLHAALAHHPLSPLLAPLFGWVVGRALLVEAGWLREGSFDPLRRAPRALWALLLLLFLGVWILRFTGALGGPADAVAPAQGALGRAIATIFSLF